ncbi:MAG: NERD domain-containing protein [Syntrophobacteraceae bacterium]
METPEICIPTRAEIEASGMDCGLKARRTAVVSIFKGWLGEKATQFGMWIKLDGETYKRFHNVIVRTGNGTTQIDHVLLSRFGIFVIETKNYNGWIFGDENQKFWTQVLHREKHRFQNPLHQNYRHVKALTEHLRVEHGKIHSVVFFIGDAELKTDLPSNVMASGLAAYIKGFNKIVFHESELVRLHQELSRLHSESISTSEHVSNLKERFSSSTICPKCGSPLIKRVARQGKQAGREFLGCSGFPNCRYIKNE